MAQFVCNHVLEGFEELDGAESWLMAELAKSSDLYSYVPDIPESSLYGKHIDMINDQDTPSQSVLVFEEDDIDMPLPRHFHLEKFTLKELVNKDMMNDRRIQLEWQCQQISRQLNRVKAQMLHDGSI